LEQIKAIEEETGTNSVALGQLGPPELSKLLWEAELLKILYGTPTAVEEAEPKAIAAAAESLVSKRSRLRDTITSLGLPVLLPDGESILRGPFVRIPEIPGETVVEVGEAGWEEWATKGWVDLRSDNWEKWQTRFREMKESGPGAVDQGSAAFAAETSVSDVIEIGSVVAWVVGREIGGRRIK
jgi:hypothetical protein